MKNRNNAVDIASELEKLVTLRDRNELTDIEFEKAKKILLSQGWVQKSANPRNQTAKLEAKEKAAGPTYCLQVAVLSTVALVFSAVSAGMNPSPLSFAALSLFAIASTLNWIEFFRGRKSK